jgi:hypothetical protein
MDFKYSPYAVFKKSKTPFGLYARATWMGESTVNLNASIERLVNAICKDQRDNGSWSDSVIKTTENLHILSLLAPEKLDVGAKAVDWLLEKEHAPMVHISGDGSPYSGLFFKLSHDDVRQIYGRNDLLFNKGCSGFFKTGAALHFAGIFGQEKDARVSAAFRSLDRALDIRHGRWCSVPCSNNILRAYVSHPKKRHSAQTKTALGSLEKFQTKQGTWKGTPFFYHTFNTVAHSDLASGRRQVKCAMTRILRSQNRDGTWGRANSEFSTFMVLDGLHQQGIL